MKHLHLRPVDVAPGSEGIEKLELRCSGGGNDAGVSALGEHVLERGGSTIRGGIGEGEFVIENSDQHLSILPNYFSTRVHS